jgi:hypothetical protein
VGVAAGGEGLASSLPLWEAQPTSLQCRNGGVRLHWKYRNDGHGLGAAQNVDLTAKRFELLREIVPSLRRLTVLFNGNNPAWIEHRSGEQRLL